MQGAGQASVQVHTLCEGWALGLSKERESIVALWERESCVVRFSNFAKRSRKCRPFKCEIPIFNGGFKKKINS